MRIFLTLGVVLALAGTAGRAEAMAAAEICEWAAIQAAHETGVPPDILGALTLTETGRRHGGTVRPWAWSVNSEGEGTWFDDALAALTYARDRLAQGVTNLDIGCFQLNYRWHGENFTSVERMFDPLESARYAARFLRDLRAESGDWRRAAGMFHSRTRRHAERYLARFDAIHASLISRGFDRMHEPPGTYNSFASVDSAQRLRVRERLTLLGAPLGTKPTGAAGSLAAIGSGRGSPLTAARGPLLFTRAQGPLLGAAGQDPPVPP
ncbi:hypothetical protein [Paracoccus ravus]|uniref:hypothetical protein n=1 Tax=Paracoccus ravus TaxID=2447760 RepID=UPI00106E56F2|nr:hypothetical protein [Paracoccus ravus]